MPISLSSVSSVDHKRATSCYNDCNFFDLLQFMVGLKWKVNLSDAFLGLNIFHRNLLSYFSTKHLLFWVESSQRRDMLAPFCRLIVFSSFFLALMTSSTQLNKIVIDHLFALVKFLCQHLQKLVQELYLGIYVCGIRVRDILSILHSPFSQVFMMSTTAILSHFSPIVLIQTCDKDENFLCA